MRSGAPLDSLQALLPRRCRPSRGARSPTRCATRANHLEGGGRNYHFGRQIRRDRARRDRAVPAQGKHYRGQQCFIHGAAAKIVIGANPFPDSGAVTAARPFRGLVRRRRCSLRSPAAAQGGGRCAESKPCSASPTPRRRAHCATAPARGQRLRPAGSTSRALKQVAAVYVRSAPRARSARQGRRPGPSPGPSPSPGQSAGPRALTCRAVGRCMALAAPHCREAEAGGAPAWPRRHLPVDRAPLQHEVRWSLSHPRCCLPSTRSSDSRQPHRRVEGTSSLADAIRPAESPGSR